jgi:PHD/YefM family antitoxin component YafN of YafNO toxin-antitoxin module
MKEHPIRWNIAAAKSRLSELLRAATQEPQFIMNRDRVVAAVVSAAAFEAYEEWRAEEQRQTLANAFAELRTLCAEERYELVTGKRQDRSNPFVDALADSPV